MANDYGQPIRSFDASSKYLDRNLFLTHAWISPTFVARGGIEGFGNLNWKEERIGEYVRRDSSLRETWIDWTYLKERSAKEWGGLKRTGRPRGYFKVEYAIHARKISKETVVVKTMMKFRSRFVRGNRIRIVSPSGSRNRQLSRVFSLKVTFLPFEIYWTTMRDVARPITLSPNLDIRFFRKEKKEKKKKKNYITLDDM